MDIIASASATATGTLVAAGPGRVRGIWVRAVGTAGTLLLKDGGTGGTLLVTINTPAAAGGHYHEIPGPGISFGTDLHATLTTADAVTVYYVSDVVST